MRTNVLLASWATVISRRLRRWPRWLGLPFHRLMHRLVGLGRRRQPALPAKKVASRLLPAPASVVPEPFPGQIVRWIEVLQDQFFYLDLSRGETAADSWPPSGIEARFPEQQRALLRREFPYVVAEDSQIVCCRLLVLERDEMSNAEILEWLVGRGAHPARAIHLLKFMYRYRPECPLEGRFLAIGDGAADVLALGKWGERKLNPFFFPYHIKHVAGDIVLALV